MKKLTPILKNLAIKDKIGTINISQLSIGSYQLNIKINCKRYDGVGRPSNNPLDYEVQIDLLNLSTVPKSSLPSRVSDVFVFLDDLRSEIIKVVSESILKSKKLIEDSNSSIENVDGESLINRKVKNAILQMVEDITRFQPTMSAS